MNLAFLLIIQYLLYLVLEILYSKYLLEKTYITTILTSSLEKICRRTKIVIASALILIFVNVNNYNTLQILYVKYTNPKDINECNILQILPQQINIVTKRFRKHFLILSNSEWYRN